MELIGNKKTIKLLDKIVVENKLANAYLFLGPESVGKFTAALAFAKKLTNKDGMGSTDSTDSTSSPQASSLLTINPDLIVIEPEVEEKKGIVKKLDIKIEAIRDLQHKLSLTSINEKYKIVIIDSAERLNKTAQNALLKTLEEPNEKVCLILIAQNERKILPTIGSRCQKIRFGLVTDVEIEKMAPSGHKNMQEIIFWSIGRPGIALDLINDPTTLEYQRKTLREFADLFAKNLSEKFSLAEIWTKDVTELLMRMDLWLTILRESMLGKDAMVNISSSKALQLIEWIAESKQLIRETNSNPRLILENLFLKF